MYFVCNVNIHWFNVIYSSEHNLYSWYLHCEHWLNVTINTMWTLLVEKLSSHSTYYCLSTSKSHSQSYISPTWIVGFSSPSHTWYLSREPREFSCKFFLAGVNFYRFNAKNWQFTVYFAVITQKIGNLLCILL